MECKNQFAILSKFPFFNKESKISQEECFAVMDWLRVTELHKGLGLDLPDIPFIGGLGYPHGRKIATRIEAKWTILVSELFHIGHENFQNMTENEKAIMFTKIRSKRKEIPQTFTFKNQSIDPQNIEKKKDPHITPEDVKAWEILKKRNGSINLEWKYCPIKYANSIAPIHKVRPFLGLVEILNRKDYVNVGKWIIWADRSCLSKIEPILLLLPIKIKSTPIETVKEFPKNRKPLFFSNYDKGWGITKDYSYWVIDYIRDLWILSYCVYQPTNSKISISLGQEFVNFIEMSFYYLSTKAIVNKNLVDPFECSVEVFETILESTANLMKNLIRRLINVFHEIAPIKHSQLRENCQYWIKVFPPECIELDLYNTIREKYPEFLFHFQPMPKEMWNQWCEYIEKPLLANLAEHAGIIDNEILQITLFRYCWIEMETGLADLMQTYNRKI